MEALGWLFILSRDDPAPASRVLQTIAASPAGLVRTPKRTLDADADVWVFGGRRTPSTDAATAPASCPSDRSPGRRQPVASMR